MLANKGHNLRFKEQILKYHTLDAVLSLPEELFFNSKVGVVTCAIIIIAHKPHPKGYKTWFGYCKNDGFIKRKTKGRVDGGDWDNIKRSWLDAYRNREEIVGFSVKKEVLATDEWCAEAYMETDYSLLTQNIFEKTSREFYAFQYINNNPFGNNLTLFDIDNWKEFKLGTLFSLNIGKEILHTTKHGIYPLISATSTNNGVNSFIDDGCKLFNKNSITVANNGSIGSAFYQEKEFFATTDITVLNNKNLNKYNALFITSIISQERYRFNYGRKWGLDRMKNFIIKLPTTKEGSLDWQFMEDYIKSLPYSKNL